MAATTTTATERVARYLAEYGDLDYGYTESTPARDAALRVTEANALACLAEGNPAEAGVWVALGQSASFKYRKSAR